MSDAGSLMLEDLFDDVGTERLAYAPRCQTLSGGWLQVDALVARSHDGTRWLAVDQPGACPDCAAVPVAAMDLPGFAPPESPNPDRRLRLRGRLAYGFAVDDLGNASYLRLENAEIVAASAP
jgi:hypothetical protein